MPLEFKAKTKDEIPADFQSLYVERDGAWLLDVDGAVDKSRVDEFRANNIALSNQLADHKRRFDGIDPTRPGSSPKNRVQVRVSNRMGPGFHPLCGPHLP